MTETPAPREIRKNVTVVFSDIVGSAGSGERLDREPLGGLITRYQEEMKHSLERHEGTVEKFIGDAVMAVFGTPVAHEDDALRAVRAASEMSERLGYLADELEHDWGVRLSARTGINSGEVIAADAPRGSQSLVLGDTVNVAARLEQAAEPGEVLLGEATYRLVRDAVQVEARAPLNLKGKREPVLIWRLLSVTTAPKPTIRALLAARLDRLAPAERELIQRASVVGKVFSSGAVAELSPDSVRPDVGRHLQALARKELIEPDPTTFSGEAAFRFRHILVRDAAYQSMPKAARMEVHERFAYWLERKNGERASEDDEIIGYHLEQAARYASELGMPDEHWSQVAARAAERLAAAGLHAFARADMPAAANLLSRASSLLPEDDPSRLELLPDLGCALWECGEIEAAESLFEQALEQARAAGDRRIEAYALMYRASLREAAPGGHAHGFPAGEHSPGSRS